MQDLGERLTSQVSSSGGGLPGRLDLERDRGARYLGASCQVLGLGLAPTTSVSRDREVDRDLGLGFNGFVALVVRLEMPLPDGVLRGGGEDVRAAHHAQILDDAIFADQRLQNHRALHFHLPRQQWIVGAPTARPNVGSGGRHLYALSSLAGYIRRSLRICGGASVSDRLRR